MQLIVAFTVLLAQASPDAGLIVHGIAYDHDIEIICDSPLADAKKFETWTDPPDQVFDPLRACINRVTDATRDWLREARKLSTQVRPCEAKACGGVEAAAFQLYKDKIGGKFPVGVSVGSWCWNRDRVCDGEQERSKEAADKEGKAQEMKDPKWQTLSASAAICWSAHFASQERGKIKQERRSAGRGAGLVNKVSLYAWQQRMAIADRAAAAARAELKRRGVTPVSCAVVARSVDSVDTLWSCIDDDTQWPDGSDPSADEIGDAAVSARSAVSDCLP